MEPLRLGWASMIKGCTVLEHALAKANMACLRDKSTTLPDFRRSLRTLSLLVGAEALRDLPMAETRVETPLANCGGHRFLRPVVIVPILRAGLGMSEALLDLLPEAGVGHVGLSRDEETFEPRSYYFKSPPLSEAEVLLVDPMLATGHSATDAVSKLKASGAKHIRLLGLIGAVPGVKLFLSRHPDVPVFLAALDESLNAKAYIVPGLGDAGDRYFGT